ncbi:Aldehyde dehydrogenase [Raoultella ornithinolytica]|nr:Aldehyde dehydrogenase [Raoultella ornithinolytica]
MDELTIFIGGRWRHGGGNLMHSYFPADGSVNATLRAASLDDLQDAMTCAERAWREPTWRNMLPHLRAKILHKVADIIESRLEELARMQSRDNGKPLAEARGLVMSAAGSARYFAAACELLEGELPTPRQADLLTLSRYEPLGVVAAITPWNSPIASEMQKVAPAIAAGNAVILKPAEATPLMALELARIFEQAGLPAGLLSVLPGKGSVIGDALARHPLVRKNFVYRRHQHRTSSGARRGGKADPGVAGARRKIADHRAGRCRYRTGGAGDLLRHFQLRRPGVHRRFAAVCA